MTSHLPVAEVLCSGGAIWTRRGSECCPLRPASSGQLSVRRRDACSQVRSRVPRQPPPLRHLNPEPQHALSKPPPPNAVHNWHVEVYNSATSVHTSSSTSEHLCQVKHPGCTHVSPDSARSSSNPNYQHSLRFTNQRNGGMDNTIAHLY